MSVMGTYSKIESYLCILFIDMGEKACFFVGHKFVGQGSGGDKAEAAGQKPAERDENPHGNGHEK